MTPRRWIIVPQDFCPFIPPDKLRRPEVGEVFVGFHARWRILGKRAFKNHDAYDAIREPSAVLVRDGEMV